MQYNYITSAALDSGLFIGMIIIMLLLGLPGVNFPSWAGNEVPFRTLDAQNLAIRVDLIRPQKIGPTEWP